VRILVHARAGGGFDQVEDLRRAHIQDLPGVSGSRTEGGAVDAELGEFALHDEEDRAVATDWRARVRPPAAP
jgi:hypothetical protein